MTACGGCNVLKGHRKLADFLLEFPAARRNFFAYARQASTAGPLYCASAVKGRSSRNAASNLIGIVPWQRRVRE